VKPIRPLSPLLRELLKASQLARRPAFAEPLRRFGLTSVLCPVWGIDSVVAGPDLYQPDEEGHMAAIVPAFEGSSIVDLVACHFGTRQMRTRKGVAAVLGHHWIEDACLGNEGLRIYDNAITWLLAKCRGVVVLDWQAAPHLLRDVPALHCESEQTAQWLQQAFERPNPYPPIVVTNGEYR
jgi:hypothetical protein